MFCKNCGAQIDDNAVVCPHCGVAQTTNPATSNVDPTDAPNIGFAILGFFIPIVGLVLFLLWKNTSPLKAKSCGKGALIGFIVNIVLYSVFFAIGIFAGLEGLAAVITPIV